MGNLFNMDNPFFSTLSKIYDMIFLSLLWLIFSLPIITIGPASTALYYATVKVIRKERGYLFREYFKSFKLNFKKGAIVGVILTIIFAILIYDVSSAVNYLAVDANRGSLGMGIYLALTFLAVGITSYVFPILSRFEMTLKALIKASIFMSMRHLHVTISMVVIYLAAIYSVYRIPLALFLAPSLSVLINSLLLERVFRKYLPEAEGTPEETGRDEWYRE